MKNFLSKIEEIEQTFTTQDTKLREELKATEQALADARERVQSLETRYKATLLKGDEASSKYRVELTVGQDTVRLLEEMAAQLRQELENGELQDALLRKHSAIVAAVEAEGNDAVHKALQAAQEARDSYRAALETLVTTQHSVADVGRRSYSRTSKLGRPLDAAQVARYTASEFMIEQPAESASAVSFL